MKGRATLIKSRSTQARLGAPEKTTKYSYVANSTPFHHFCIDPKHMTHISYIRYISPARRPTQARVPTIHPPVGLFGQFLQRNRICLSVSVCQRIVLFICLFVCQNALTSDKKLLRVGVIILVVVACILMYI